MTPWPGPGRTPPACAGRAACPPDYVGMVTSVAARRGRVEDLAQPAREGLRLAGVAELAAEKATVVAREHGRLLAEQLGGGRRRASSEDALGLLAHGNDDPRRRRGQRGDVGAIAADRPRAIGEQRVVARAVVLGRHPEGSRIRPGLREVLVGELAPP